MELGDGGWSWFMQWTGTQPFSISPGPGQTRGQVKLWWILPGCFLCCRCRNWWALLEMYQIFFYFWGIRGAEMLLWPYHWSGWSRPNCWYVHIGTWGSRPSSLQYHWCRHWCVLHRAFWCQWLALCWRWGKDCCLDTMLSSSLSPSKEIDRIFIQKRAWG